VAFYQASVSYHPKGFVVEGLRKLKLLQTRLSEPKISQAVDDSIISAQCLFQPNPDPTVLAPKRSRDFDFLNVDHYFHRFPKRLNLPKTSFDCFFWPPLKDLLKPSLTPHCNKLDNPLHLIHGQTLAYRMSLGLSFQL
jgi:hypothetical protein